jgi:hypothetical protein
VMWWLNERGKVSEGGSWGCPSHNWGWNGMGREVAARDGEACLGRRRDRGRPERSSRDVR